MAKFQTLASLRETMVASGWAKRGGAEVFTKPVNDSVLGWVGFNGATSGLSKGDVKVHPVVGVHFKEVEKLIAEALGNPKSRPVVATLSRPLYLLMPGRYQDWFFSHDGSSSPADNLVEAVEEYGWPFMSKMADLARAVQVHMDGTEIFRPNALPFVLAVNGSRMQALDLLDQEFVELRSRPYSNEQHLQYLVRARAVIENLS